MVERKIPVKKRVLHIENLDCPICAQALQEDLQKIKGVESVAVDYVTQTITLSTVEEKALAKVIATANAFEEVRVLDGKDGRKKESHKKEWGLISLSAVLFAVGFCLETFLIGRGGGIGKIAKIFAYIAYAVAYFAVGYPVLISTCKNIAKGRIFDENFLMTIASIGAICLQEYGEAVLVMLLYQLGELLQAIAVGSSRQSVADLMDLKSEFAVRLDTVGGEEKQIQVSPEEVRVGDILLVKAGEKVPVDGVLLSERGSFDTKSLTGEAEWKTVEKGEEILSGYINGGEVCKMRATREYENSAVARILDMVENASQGKAAPERFIAKFAKIYTPVVCILALCVAVFAPLLHGVATGEGFTFYQPARWVQSALTFLVISCPCALIISVPLTYFSGIGACARRGILVKGATYLDEVAKAKIIAFDKTGTLTEGEFCVRKVSAVGIDEKRLLALTASVESTSSHPIARAFDGYEKEYAVEKACEVAGKGISALVDGEEVLVGNSGLLKEAGVPFVEVDSVYTVMYIAKNGRYLGCIEVGDGLRKGAKESVVALKRLGLERVVMLTGDQSARAAKVAYEAGVEEVFAELLPDEKLQKAEALKRQGGLMYIGDGINDAPVMVTADCAVSMGKLGSAAAIEASDLVLISDDISALPAACKIARKTRKIVLQNIVFSIVMKVGFMALGALGLLPLWLAVFADVGVMLLAVLNSFRVRFLSTK